MRMSARTYVLAGIAVLFRASAALAMTVTLQQGLNGYAGTTDAWLDESSYRHNNGGSIDLRVQWYNGRSDCTDLKFDLAARIPAGSTIESATLTLWYQECGSMSNDNAVTIKPFRLQPSAWWDENIYDDVNGYGVSYKFRDANETYQWTGGVDGGWSDKIDDGNGVNKIKKTGGTPPDAVEPQNFISWDVTPSVRQWVAGQTNNGFLLVATDFVGSGNIAWGIFRSRHDSGVYYCPALVITYDTPVPVLKSTWGGIKNLYR